MRGEESWDGWMEQVEEEMFLAGLPLANLTHIVAELSFPPGNHLTLIKGGKGRQRREKGWQCFHPGKKLSAEIRGQPGNSSVCCTGQEKIGEKRKEEREKKKRAAGMNGGWLSSLRGVSTVIPSTFFTHTHTQHMHGGGGTFFKCFHRN